MQWLTKKSNGWGEDELNGNEATVLQVFLREMNVAEEVFFIDGALYFIHNWQKM